MKTVPISHVKRRLSALVKEVQGGESVLITDRGVPVARLIRVPTGRGMSARVIGLAQRGLARLPEQVPSAKWLDLPWPKVAHGSSPVNALLSDRREGR